jgi:hypothetical protein
MATGLNLLPYAYQQSLCERFEAQGHGTVAVRRNRNGSLRLRLGERKTELCVHDAMHRIEVALGYITEAQPA